jgi:hypothetical protein
MITKPKTRKTPAVTPGGINPKLIALAAKFDKAETEFGRVLTDVVAPAEQRLFANREDKAARGAVEEAERLEAKTCDASIRAAKKFSAVRATNLEELVLKARYVSKDGIEHDLHVAQSIIDDLLAMDGESINRFIAGRLEEMS